MTKEKAKEKRKYWLQLKADFFMRKHIRALMRFDLGAVVIYEKLMLLSLDNKGRVMYENYFDTIGEELADAMGIPQYADLTQHVIDDLLKHGIVIDEGNGVYYLPEAMELSGSECGSAERTRDYRERKAAAAETTETEGDSGDGEGELSQCDGNTLQCSVEPSQNGGNKSKVKDKAKTKNSYNSSLSLGLDLQRAETDTPAAAAGAGGGASSAPFTFEDARECADEIAAEKGLALSDLQVKNFLRWMEEFDWKINGHKVTKLKNAVSGYAKKHGKPVGAAADTTETEVPEEKAPEKPKKKKLSREERVTQVNETIFSYFPEEQMEIWSRSDAEQKAILITAFVPRDALTEQQTELARKLYGERIVLVRHPENVKYAGYRKAFVPRNEKIEREALELLRENTPLDVQYELSYFYSKSRESQKGWCLWNNDATLIRAFCNKYMFSAEQLDYFDKRLDLQLSDVPPGMESQRLKSLLEFSQKHPDIYCVHTEGEKGR